jgi:hypothetical protein
VGNLIQRVETNLLQEEANRKIDAENLIDYEEAPEGGVQFESDGGEENVEVDEIHGTFDDIMMESSSMLDNSMLNDSKLS